jgi:hypothetical protein
MAAAFASSGLLDQFRSDADAASAEEPAADEAVTAEAAISPEELEAAPPAEEPADEPEPAEAEKPESADAGSEEATDGAETAEVEDEAKV